jgi:hypothetical protein
MMRTDIAGYIIDWDVGLNRNIALGLCFIEEKARCREGALGNDY